MPDKTSLGYWSSRAQRVPRGKESRRLPVEPTWPRPTLMVADPAWLWDHPEVDWRRVYGWIKRDEVPTPFKVTPAGRLAASRA